MYNIFFRCPLPYPAVYRKQPSDLRMDPILHSIITQRNPDMDMISALLGSKGHWMIPFIEGPVIYNITFNKSLAND